MNSTKIDKTDTLGRHRFFSTDPTLGQHQILKNKRHDIAVQKGEAMAIVVI